MLGWMERKKKRKKQPLSLSPQLTDATVAVSDSRPPIRELTPETLACV